ncbi:hypothetical protein [Aeromicrobium wangtongii]|uniref:DUF4190 domain-containing protein n=1 Tax=Aeromicrobium wangtongii TaxID=2969247 RepID=A0ABY5MAC0_9ACTN|nr:hypothetical protein [Aeromicrobium wangtongii]MCD9197590.1 hypothetical protein [Aeromicrobium wangtongii]UUP15080.1 hypothetical protein NQV15_07140 [Aeromicrobium wangtongii]
MSEPGAPDAGPGAAGVVTNRKAVYSVVCGVLAFAGIYLSPAVGLVLGLPSVTSAVHARREIVEAKGQQTGDSLAVMGLMIGGGAVVTVALWGMLQLLG